MMNQTGRLPFIYNSASHAFLLVAASRTNAVGYVTASDGVHILHRFERESRVRETARHLVSHGLLEETGDDEWAITIEGRFALQRMATRAAKKSETGRVLRYRV
jgi:hypothetical protein